MSKWLGADWRGHTCDIMHDIKCFVEMLCKGLVGYQPNGMYKAWKGLRRDAQHRDDCEVYDMFPDFYKSTTALPPWRLSTDAVNVMDLRVRSMWWPHYMDKLCKKGHSFWTHSDRMWKCSHKFYILMAILPTCLSGFVPRVHRAIICIVTALARLFGSVISAAEADQRGLERGARVLEKVSLFGLREELTRGLVLLEGCFPLAHLNPAMHHFVHYVMQTADNGILGWVSMFSFERNNKRIKGLIRNSQHPLATLANNIRMDIATRFLSWSEKDYKFPARPPVCVLWSRRKGNYHNCTERERFHLASYGICQFRRVKAFETARILGQHFRAGEWGCERCGSVITTMYAGRSRYCNVKKFLQVQDKSFALVDWLSVPEYPYAPSRLVVRVRLMPDQHRHRCVIPVERIEPCSVAVMPDADGVHFYMMRDKGYDRATRR